MRLLGHVCHVEAVREALLEEHHRVGLGVVLHVIVGLVQAGILNLILHLRRGRGVSAIVCSCCWFIGARHNAACRRRRVRGAELPLGARIGERESSNSRREWRHEPAWQGSSRDRLDERDRPRHAARVAAEGADMVLNGFGDAAGSPGCATSLAERHGVRAVPTTAPTWPSRPGRRPGRPGARSDWAASTSWSTTPASSTRPRSRQFPPRELGRDDRDQPLGGLSRDAAASRPWPSAAGGASSTSPGARPGREREQAAYVAAKHGIIGLTKVAALELAATGVTSTRSAPAGY